MLKDALITSVQLSGSNENPTESVSFAFQGVEIAYKAENDDGTLAGAVGEGLRPRETDRRLRRRRRILKFNS